jgi:hypothetical protein
MDMHFCEYCGGAIYPDDLAPIKLEVKGQLHRFYFHNRYFGDCLSPQTRGTPATIRIERCGHPQLGWFFYPVDNRLLSLTNNSYFLGRLNLTVGLSIGRCH